MGYAERHSSWREESYLNFIKVSRGVTYNVIAISLSRKRRNIFQRELVEFVNTIKIIQCGQQLYITI